MRRTAVLLVGSLAAGIAAGLASPGSGGAGRGWSPGRALALGAIGISGAGFAGEGAPTAGVEARSAPRAAVFDSLRVRAPMARRDAVALPLLAHLPPARPGKLWVSSEGALTVVCLGVRN